MRRSGVSISLRCLLVGALCVVVVGESCSAEQTETGITLIDKWIKALPFPDSEHVSQDLADIKLFDDEHLRQARNAYAHTKPPALFKNEKDVKGLVADIGGMLRRGVNRFRKTFEDLLPTIKSSSYRFFIHKARAILNSYNDFYVQVINGIRLGPTQLEHLPQHAEYGPETNFWVKFRPYLTCAHTPRMGPEFGGIKNWCNFGWFYKNHPKYVLSGGSGADFAFEDTLLELFPEAKVVTLDCFQHNSSAYGDPDHPRDPNKLIFVEECLHGKRDEDLVVFKDASGKVSTYPDLADRLKTEKNIPYFDLHKLNIEAFEYPTYGHIMRDADKHLAGLKQIHLEMHRHGMADHGLCWDSMLLSELLFATFYSGGFHPVAQEKWHDATGAGDYVFVNQTWYLLSELDAFESVFEDQFPLDRKEVDQVTRKFDWSTFYGFQHAREETTEEVEVHVENIGDGDVMLLWVSPDGEFKDSGLIKAGEFTSQTTYPGHTFKWRYEDDEVSASSITIVDDKTHYNIL